MALRPPKTTLADRAAIAAFAGQCARCAQVQVLRSRRSTFARCGRADHDPAFARYPVLPMSGCPGFAAAAIDRPGDSD